MSEGQVSKTKLVVSCIGAAALGALAWHLFSHDFGGDDSPIVVRDGGSIELESSGKESLDDFIVVNDNLIYHPEGKWKMKKIARTGITSPAPTCRGSGTCRIEVTYSDSPTPKLTIGSGTKGKGVWISSAVPFSTWDRANRKKWVLRISTLKISEVRVFGTNQADGTALCTAAGCEVTTDYSK